MAEIAIVTLWQYVCPYCPHSARHWQEERSCAAAEDHLYVAHDRNDAADPVRRTWAFRVGAKQEIPTGK